MINLRCHAIKQLFHKCESTSMITAKLVIFCLPPSPLPAHPCFLQTTIQSVHDFYFVAFKVVYRIVLESTNIFQCVPGISIFIYVFGIIARLNFKYDDRKYHHSCMHKCHPATALWYKFIIVCFLPSLPTTPHCYLLLPLPDLFSFVYYFGYFMTHSQGAILFCF